MLAVLYNYVLVSSTNRHLRSCYTHGFLIWLGRGFGLPLIVSSFLPLFSVALPLLGPIKCPDVEDMIGSRFQIRALRLCFATARQCFKESANARTSRHSECGNAAFERTSSWRPRQSNVAGTSVSEDCRHTNPVKHSYSSRRTPSYVPMRWDYNVLRCSTTRNVSDTRCMM